MMVWNSDDLLGSNGMGAVSLLAGDRNLFFPGNIRGNTGDSVHESAVGGAWSALPCQPVVDVLAQIDFLGGGHVS